MRDVRGGRGEEEAGGGFSAQAVDRQCAVHRQCTGRAQCAVHRQCAGSAQCAVHRQCAVYRQCTGGAARRTRLRGVHARVAQQPAQQRERQPHLGQISVAVGGFRTQRRGLDGSRRVPQRASEEGSESQPAPQPRLGIGARRLRAPPSQSVAVSRNQPQSAALSRTQPHSALISRN